MAKLAPLLAELRGESPKVARTSLQTLMRWKGTLVLAKRSPKTLQKFKVRPGKSELWHFGDSLTFSQKEERIHSKKSIFLIGKDRRPLVIPEGVFYLMIRSVGDIYKGNDFFFRKLDVEIQLEMIETEEKKQTLRSTGDRFEPAEFRNPKS
jgi:hypothetical protein